MITYLIKFEKESYLNGFYHDKIKYICGARTIDGNYFFKGTIDEFYQKWSNDFRLQYPISDLEKEFISGTIWIKL